MKFLKTFENQQEYLNKYMTISQFEAELFDRQSSRWWQPKSEKLINCLEFTTEEIESIKKIVSESLSSSKFTKKSNSYRLVFDIGSGSSTLEIYKKDDSWYPACISGLSAAFCDDLGGLQHWLKTASKIVDLLHIKIKA